MLQDFATIQYKHELFVKRVAASTMVWGLKDEEGWANSSSNDDEDTEVMLFWSDKAYAKACARDEWEDYLPVEIPLAEFLENWCVGMDQDDTLAGTNWDANMFGMEIEALTLALEILNQLKTQSSVMKFQNYSSVEEFSSAIISSK